MGERAKAQEKGTATGRFDYKVKAKFETMNKETTALDKLLYLYQENDSRYASINNKEKAHRIKAL